MLKEAVRRGVFPSDPSALIKELAAQPATRGILSADELHQLFDENRIEQVWAGDEKHFTQNMLAASTGLRMGEIQGLLVDAARDSRNEPRQAGAE